MLESDFIPLHNCVKSKDKQKINSNHFAMFDYTAYLSKTQNKHFLYFPPGVNSNDHKHLIISYECLGHKMGWQVHIILFIYQKRLWTSKLAQDFIHLSILFCIKFLIYNFQCRIFGVL